MLRYVLAVAAIAPVLSNAAHADKKAATRENAKRFARLTFCCSADNDLYRAVDSSDTKANRFDAVEAAIENAGPETAVVILADGYPKTRVRVDEDVFASAREKRLRLYIEYPDAIPGVRLDEPKQLQWERAVVASNAVDLGLPVGRILSPHDCHILPSNAREPLLVAARVAGFDTAVYGLPPERFPLLFKTDDGVLVATTKLSNFVTGRFAPVKEWRVLWQYLLDELDPAGAPHHIDAHPLVRPRFTKDEKLPDDFETAALASAATWLQNSRLFLSRDRQPEIHELLRAGGQVVPMPSDDAPKGDGSCGILEGYVSRILPDGTQLQCPAIRADCQAESAAVLAMHAAVAGDKRSRQIAENLLDYLYIHSDMLQGVRGDPKHPAFGHIGWGAIGPAWQIANYGDDNARTILATILAATALKTPKWDAAVLKALYANLRTTGKFGFRGDRIDNPTLEQYGWKHFHDGETVNLSPHFEGYLWACYLWAYERTGEREFLDRTKVGIRMTMDGYPNAWRWGDNLERAHMLLPLAWLVRVEDTPEHRQWLQQVAGDLLKDQDECGAIAERLRSGGAGHYVVPQSNEAYGTSETPLIQENGDPVSDQLYTTGFALLGLREAAAAMGDAKLRDAENRLAEYLARIQVRSEKLPYLDGAWFRAFDFGKWDYWASSADLGWGAWNAEAGWGPAWIPVVFGLRAQETTLWDATSSSRTAEQMEPVKRLMSQNDGGPK